MSNLFSTLLSRHYFDEHLMFWNCRNYQWFIVEHVNYGQSFFPVYFATNVNHFSTTSKRSSMSLYHPLGKTPYAVYWVKLCPSLTSNQQYLRSCTNFLQLRLTIVDTCVSSSANFCPHWVMQQILPYTHNHMVTDKLSCDPLDSHMIHWTVTWSTEQSHDQSYIVYCYVKDL